MLVSADKKAINTAPASPAAKLSKPTAKYINGTSCPRQASRINIRLVAAASTAPAIIIFISEKRCESKPPKKPPAIAIITPKVFTAAAISSLLKPIS